MKSFIEDNNSKIADLESSLEQGKDTNPETENLKHKFKKHVITDDRNE